MSGGGGGGGDTRGNNAMDPITTHQRKGLKRAHVQAGSNNFIYKAWLWCTPALKCDVKRTRTLDTTRLSFRGI